MSRPDSGGEPTRKRRSNAKTAEQREEELIAAATDLAAEQIRKGTVSAQVLTHYIKLGGERERLERDRLKRENELLKAKVDQLASTVRSEDLLERALKAMTVYQGGTVDEEEEFIA